jgi:hypothetical protein
MSKFNRMERGNYGICDFHQKLVGRDGKCSVCVEQETRAPKTEHRALEGVEASAVTGQLGVLREEPS